MPAGLRQRLHARGHVDAIAVQPLALGGDVAQVDADPIEHASLGPELGVSLSEHALDLDRATQRLEGGGKLGQHVVARRVHHAAALALDAALHRLSMRREGADRARLVLGHEAAVSDGICAEDGGEAPLDVIGSHGWIHS